MILIKGMEMPTRCFACPMCDEEVNCVISHGPYLEYREVDTNVAIQERPSWCPLIELPEDVQPVTWIPVTERLPECNLGAEVGNIEWISCGMVHAGCFGRGGKYRDAYFRTWTDAGEGMDAKDADYWRAVTLPEPPKDELIAKQEEDAEIFMGSTNYGDKVRYDEAMNAVANIVNAPTVIPADKDGDA